MTDDSLSYAHADRPHFARKLLHSEWLLSVKELPFAKVAIWGR